MAISPKRILIVSASIGGGHTAAARALEGAALEHELEVKHVDMLDYTTAPFRRLYRQAYFDLVRTAPDLVDWLGRRLDRRAGEKKTRQERMRARLVRLVSYQLPRLIRHYEPDVLLHTHFLPPEILSALGNQHLAPQALVITDVNTHSLWMQPGIRRYFVAAEEVAVHLRASGVEASRLVVSGIPIDVRFTQLPPKAEARAALGIPVDRDLLLVMAGGLDEAPLHDIVEGLKALRIPLHVFIICGRSEQLVSGVQRQLDDYQGLVHIHVLGFSREVPRYMAAADMLLGKPGGLTSSEALAAGLPFAVVQPYPIQEESNATYLLENGAGIRIEPLTVLGYKLRRFFEDAQRRQQMSQAARALAKPEAARMIIRSLLEEPLSLPESH